MCFRAADYCMSATELNLSYALQNTLIPQIHSQSQYSSFWQIFLTTAIFAPLLAPLIWSKFWGLPKLITAFLLCLWQEAGTNITTKLSCISSPFFYWWWMVLPLSQETRKSQKSSPHPLFSTQMMYRLWRYYNFINYNIIRHYKRGDCSRTAGTETLTGCTLLSRPLTLLAIPFIPQMLSVFYVYPWSTKKQIYFFQSSPLLDPQCISSLLPRLLFHDLETQHFSLEEQRNDECRTGQGSWSEERTKKQMQRERYTTNCSEWNSWHFKKQTNKQKMYLILSPGTRSRIS